MGWVGVCSCTYYVESDCDSNLGCPQVIAKYACLCVCVCVRLYRECTYTHANAQVCVCPS